MGLVIRPRHARARDRVAAAGRWLREWWGPVLFGAIMVPVVVLIILLAAEQRGNRGRCEAAGGEVDTYDCVLVGKVMSCKRRCLFTPERP
jgi:hypothetical protein